MTGGNAATEKKLDAHDAFTGTVPPLAQTVTVTLTE